MKLKLSIFLLFFLFSVYSVSALQFAINSSGGNCANFANWNNSTKVCKLSSNLVNTSIKIISDGITLDGNGFYLKDSKDLVAITLVNGVNGSVIQNLTITNYSKAISLAGAFSNTIRSNYLYNNKEGIVFEDNLADKNLIYWNTIVNTSQAQKAIFLDAADQNIIYNNNFINNYISKKGNANANKFNLDKPLGGNYWSNFDSVLEGCKDVNGDFFCDLAFTKNNIRDNFPWIIANGWLESTPPVTNVVLNGRLFGSWYNSNVALQFSAFDANGINYTSYSFDNLQYFIYANNTINLTNNGIADIYYFSQDKFGNKENTKTKQIKIDKIPPNISGSLLISPNEYNWTNTSNVATFFCADNLSGPISAQIDVQVGQGFNQSANATCFDNANNSAKLTISGINIDQARPNIFSTIQGTKNQFGWYANDVLIKYNCTDSLSGVFQYPNDVLISSEGINQEAEGICFDFAQNSAEQIITDLNLDLTPPQIVLDLISAPSNFGWFNSSVIYITDCFDDLSGVFLDFKQSELMSQGMNQIINGTCENKAGLNSSDTIPAINIDLENPAVTANIQSQPNEFNWFNSAVTINYQCTDNLSGPKENQFDEILIDDGLLQTSTWTCYDLAKNSATQSFYNISIDTAPPEISSYIQESPNENNWFNNSITGIFNCSDSLSGVINESDVHIESQEGFEVDIQGHCDDRAGNTVTGFLAAAIDMTAPIIVGSPMDLPNEFGNYTAPLSVQFNCTDNLSGVIDSQIVVVLSSGENQEASATCYDFAGNMAQLTLSGLNVS